MSHEHNLKDADLRFVIDAELNITHSGEVKTLRQGDHRSEIVSFEMPRYIEGHDMAQCNKVEVHYNNIKNDAATRTVTTNKSFDEVEAFSVAADDESKVVFSWLIKGDATQLDGTLNFCIRFACMEGETITYQKFTEIFESVPVGVTIHNTEAVAKESADVLAAWRNELLIAIENGGAVKTVNGVPPDESGNVAIDIESEVLATLNALDIINIATNENGETYTDENGNVLII